MTLSADLRERNPVRRAPLAGYTTLRVGGPATIVTLEDRDDEIEALCFPDDYALCGEHLAADSVALVEGFIMRKEEDLTQLVLQDVIPLEQVPQRYTREVLLKLPPESEAQQNGLLEHLQQTLLAHPGETDVILTLPCANGRTAYVEVGSDYRVRFDEELQVKLRRLLGDHCFRAKPDRTAPERRPRRRAPEPAET